MGERVRPKLCTLRAPPPGLIVESPGPLNCADAYILWDAPFPLTPPMLDRSEIFTIYFFLHNFFFFTVWNFFLPFFFLSFFGTFVFSYALSADDRSIGILTIYIFFYWFFLSARAIGIFATYFFLSIFFSENVRSMGIFAIHWFSIDFFFCQCSIDLNIPDSYVFHRFFFCKFFDKFLSYFFHPIYRTKKSYPKNTNEERWKTIGDFDSASWMFRHCRLVLLTFH